MCKKSQENNYIFCRSRILQDNLCFEQIELVRKHVKKNVFIVQTMKEFL